MHRIGLHASDAAIEMIPWITNINAASESLTPGELSNLPDGELLQGIPVKHFNANCLQRRREINLFTGECIIAMSINRFN